MEDTQEHQSIKETSSPDTRAARMPSSPARAFGSLLPWHGQLPCPASVFEPNREETFQGMKESSLDAQRPQIGGRKWTVSPLNHGFLSLGAMAGSSGSASVENSAMAFPMSSNTQNLSPSDSLTSSCSSIGFSDGSETDVRSWTNLLGTPFSSSQLPPIYIGRLWEEAIASQNVQIVQQILKCGFDASGDGAQMSKPPLTLAVLTGNGAMIKLLLNAGAEINCMDSESLTPLHHAAAAGDRRAVKLLLVAGADLYSRTREGLFPIHLAMDGPTFQMLSQRLKSDMNKPFMPSRVGLPPQRSSSGNLVDFESGALSESNTSGLQSKDTAIENQSNPTSSLADRSAGLFSFRCNSFGQSDFTSRSATSDLSEDAKMHFPLSRNVAVLSGEDVGECTGAVANNSGKEDSNTSEDWMFKFHNRNPSGKGKQPMESENEWLHQLSEDKAKSQEATRAIMLRKQELKGSGGQGQVEGKDTDGQRLHVPEETLGRLSKNLFSASSTGSLENQEAGIKAGNVNPSAYLLEKKSEFGNIMDRIFNNQEDYLTTSRALHLERDQKPVLDSTACNVLRPARSEPGLSECSSHLLGSKDEGMHSNTLPEKSCIRNPGQLKQKEQIAEHGNVPTERTTAMGGSGSSGEDNTSQSKSVSQERTEKDENKLKEDTKWEVTSEVLSAHDQDSDTQTKGTKEMMSVPPSEADLALVRKDWHDAVHAGCVGCGVEGCGGVCLSKNAYGKTNQEKTRIEPSCSRSKKIFRKAQMKKTKNFDWKRGELIGEGAYGKVFCGLNQSTGELMAVKQLKFRNTNDDEEKSFLTGLEREIALYKEMRHKHIVGYIDMDKDEKSGYLYIFLEYVSGGSIQSMLERFGPFSEPLVCVYARQLLLGLEYLHKNRIVHRDIKGGNVLVDSDGVVKLADFGASKAFHDATITDACKSIRGSVFWMAPEVIKGVNYGRHADMWSVGCTVIEMLTAMHPWPGIDNTWAAIFQIAKASSGPPLPPNASDCAKDFLSKCFQLDPKMRPSASELLQHPFVVAKASEESSQRGRIENL